MSHVVKWVAPTKRSDNSPLSAGEIARYEVQIDGHQRDGDYKLIGLSQHLIALQGAAPGTALDAPSASTAPQAPPALVDPLRLRRPLFPQRRPT